MNFRGIDNLMECNTRLGSGDPSFGHIRMVSHGVTRSPSIDGVKISHKGIELDRNFERIRIASQPLGQS